MKTVAVCSQKGGPGKTMLSLNLNRKVANYRRDNWSSYDKAIANALCDYDYMTKTDFNRMYAWIPTDNRNNILQKMLYYGQITFSRFTRRYKATDRLHRSILQERYI